jgi:chromosome segregation ATPase
MIESLEEQISKFKLCQKEIKEYQTKIRGLESELREIESSCEFAKNQLSKAKTKITKQRKAFEAKEEQVQAAISEAMKKKHEVEQRCAEDEAKLRPVLTLIEEKKEQLQRLKDYHHFNMNLMQARFSQLRRQLVEYHAELQRVMTSDP